MWFHIMFLEIFLFRKLISLRSKVPPCAALVYQVLGVSWTLEKLRAAPLFENIISNKFELDWFQIQDNIRFIQGEKAVKMTIFYKR